MYLLSYLAGPLSRRKLLAAWLLWPACVLGQANLSGNIETANHDPVPGAVVRIQKSFLSTVSDANGHFSLNFPHEDSVVVEVTHISYNPMVVRMKLPASPLTISLQEKTYLSEEVNITATRADNQSAVAFTNLDKHDLEARNLGQDIPFLIQFTPSVVVTSDAGTGTGYTGLRIRGSDGTRVNVTLNGIPVNDAESHMVYWVDLPDLASSTENIQIQRGLGTSTNGAGAFGGSVNMLTTQLNQKPYGTLNSSIGSFNTFKNTLSFGSGVMGKRFALEGRLSKISSDGYIDRATSDLRSLFLTAGYYGSKSSLRFVVLTGKEKTYQAWYGVPEDSLKTNRTFNPAGMYFDTDGNMRYYQNQTDNYRQDYYQLLFSHQINKSWNVNAALHYTKGKGYYEEYAAGDYFSTYGLPDIIHTPDTIKTSDFIRQRWLDNDFYGFTWSVNYHQGRFDFRAGGAGNRYSGDHFGKLNWSKDMGNNPLTAPYYSDRATKDDLTAYAKINYAVAGQLHLFADMQVRSVQYTFIGLAHSGIMEQQHRPLNFFNPKAGITFDLSDKHACYFSFSTGHKEPVRDDYLNVSPAVPKAERLFDYEAGYKFKGQSLSAAINFYYMDYRDQLILTGKINDVGEYTRQNIPLSYRAGVELEFHYRFAPKWELMYNATFSMNKIKSYHEYLYNYDTESQDSVSYSNSDIAFSPSVITGGILRWEPFHSFTVELSEKFVGKQFLDNTSNEKRKLNSYLLHDIRIQYVLTPAWMREIGVNVLVNNFLNRKYESNGYTWSEVYGGQTSTYNYYYPQAGTNWALGVSLKF